MKKISDRQASLFDVSAYESAPDSKYLWEDGYNQELGTKNYSVPNSSLPELGVCKILVNSPLPELGTDKIPVPNSSLPELGTDKIPVPNSPLPELGTDKIPVPNSPLAKLGTDKSLVPNSDFDELGTGKTERTRAEIWKPPVGLLVQTWVKNDWYWYWKYYDNRRKKRSIYLGKKYNKAVAKAQLIGMPADAKPSKIRASPPET